MLGTWSGPGWDPTKSTLLQLLVSIQAFIFCDNPYYNEPGYEGQPVLQSEAYNKTLHGHTVRRAILAPLQNPHARPHSVFQEVLALHWRNKRDVIKYKLVDWRIDVTTRRQVESLLDAV